jgi:hypothetical protein
MIVFVYLIHLIFFNLTVLVPLLVDYRHTSLLVGRINSTALSSLDRGSTFVVNVKGVSAYGVCSMLVTETAGVFE